MAIAIYLYFYNVGFFELINEQFKMVVHFD